MSNQPGDSHFRNQRVEEKEGPLQRPRSNLKEVLTDETSDNATSMQEGGRPATESLLHTQRIAEGLFDVCRKRMTTPTGMSGAISPFDIYCSKMPLTEGRRPDAFDVLKHVFEFQESSVCNQRDNAISMLASRLSRAVGRELENLVSVQDAALVLEAFRGELLSNYTRWCAFMGINPVSFESLFGGSAKSAEFGMATESALMLLVWGEAGNLRFCPEFLCFVFHRLAEMFKKMVEGRDTQVKVPSYLEQVIVPAYHTVASELADVGHGVIDHSKVCNYDDFNEIFWQSSCLDLNINTMFEGKTMKRRFQKTFVERQSWLVPIFSFWRVHTLHMVGLHLMVVAAKCQLSLDDDNEVEGDLCVYSEWFAPAITLYACSFVRDAWDVKQALYISVGHRGGFGQLGLNIFRMALKGVMAFLLEVLYLAADSSVFVGAAVVFLAIALFLEGIMLTELWWGIASYGKWGASTERSLSGGGFAACVPARIRHLGFAIVGSLCGINAVNLYTQVHSLPPITKRIRYICFWGLVLGTKIAFSYFVVVKKLTLATYVLYFAAGTEYDFSIFGQTLEVTDEHNLLYIIALWLGSGLIYFLDMQIWFVIWANIAAAVEGVRRRVGELNDNAQVVRAFSHLHKAFFSYLRRDMLKSTLHTRFAHIWNEIVDAMREEDIISDRERLQLRYFLINLRLPKAVEPSRRTGFAAELEEGDWGPFFTLLPEFLMSGAVQRAVQHAVDFGKEIAGDLSEIETEEMLARQQSQLSTGVSGVPMNTRRQRAETVRARLASRQAKFLVASGNDQVTTEMVRQLSATAFNLMDALCRNEKLSRSFWNLHRALFASDVNQAGHGIGKATGWIRSLTDEFGTRKDKPAAKVLSAFSKRTILFSVQNFPGFIAAMSDLVKALNEHVSSKDWDKAVASKLDKFASAMLALLETNAQSVPDDKSADAFLRMLKDISVNLETWREQALESGSIAPGARSFKAHSKEFLKRTHIFLTSPWNSQPGLVKGAEARRRIKFFVNSLFIEQPKPKRVLQMPSLTTLTPYYNEDVVLSIESLREETQDGVTVLEYLRTIYPDEFTNLVERMRIISQQKSKGFLFNVDVIDPLLDIVLSPELGTDVSRENVVRQVEKAIITAAKHLRAESDENQDPIPQEEIARAIKNVDVDYMVLQLQMWASFRGQTLSRTVRGIMYYSQAVRLLAVVENIEEFQSKETGYMFGSSDRPEDEEDEEDGEGHGSLHGIAQAALQHNRGNRSEDVGADDSGHHRFSRGAARGVRRTGGPDESRVEGFRLFRWARGTGDTPTSSGVGHRSGQKSFRTAFTDSNPQNLEATLNQEIGENLDVLEAGPSSEVRRGRSRKSGHGSAGDPPPVPPRPRVRPADVAAGEDSGHSKSPPRTGGGGKLKAAVLRAMEAQRREREMAQKRGRRKQKEDASAANDFQGFVQVKDPALDKVCLEYGLTAELAEAKYRYVISCQVFGKMQKSKKKADQDKAAHIKMLARMYPGLRIAHVDEKDGSFYSVLSKHGGGSGDEMVEEYRVKLPGQILVGEGKPNNQNHAIIFTRGEAIQAIDMNQDASLEDAIKIRQVMEEFNFANGGTGRGRNIGRIVGFREHVFTHDVSAVANFFSLQELNFVSATQRALDNPLHIRFHYGHPDVFDRISAITMGGISKACKGIHLSEDIFAGFNYVLRGGESTQADYIQVAKGRDTGVSQVTGFTAKISMGNGMQCRSRDVNRLASQLDIFRLLSFYYSSVGGFMNQVLLIVAVFLYVYAKLYIVFDPEFNETVDDEVINALSSQFLFQLGFLLILPIPLLLAVEEGIQRAFSTLFNILIRLAPFFFIFSAGTNAHYVNSAVQTGQAKYNATGRGFVIAHEEFLDMFRLYLVSHFSPGFELLVVLIVYAQFSSDGYFLETFSVYLLSIGLLWTPVIFNPNGLDFTYASRDFTDWLEWMGSPVDDPKKGWLAWYNNECEKARLEWPLDKKIQAFIRRGRLLILVYGFLTAVGEDTDGGLDGDWPGTVFVGAILLVIIALLMCQSWIRSMCCPPKVLKYGVQQARWARLWRLLLLVALIVALIALGSLDVIDTFKQVVYFFLAFVILVFYCAQAVVLFTENALKNIKLVGIAFKSVHMGIGFVIMLPILALSFFPLFVDLQTRMLFNEEFSQSFSIAKIFARQNNRRTVKKTN